ncbi:uncharacterized protein LOC112846667 [Oreochromis niloticus]|uniref:uncharacterized protein LOC112846667 n=1 Tax=Oreochromis niloticus TaxID=8128 RepID=UPI000DF28D2A|nr:uncharacterized protein LOC112846667 [Oreochromis niloticus]CAI5672224.1 unnamed protein product [Mustela putorius furo]
MHLDQVDLPSPLGYRTARMVTKEGFRFPKRNWKMFLKTSFTEAASILSISRPTLYKLLQDYNISVSKFNVISDHELEQIVSQIKTEHPHVGEVMLMGHLRSKNIVVQRWRVRESLRRVDSAGVLSRRRTAVARRVYSVPHPNFIWHIDGNHKLIRWKFVVHGAIDGYSRMLMFLQCSSNNRAETVKALFTAAVGQFGRPLHIRTDHGGENAQIWEEMRASRGESSVLMGSSVHNQRIERFNRDLNNNCTLKKMFFWPCNYYFNYLYKFYKKIQIQCYYFKIAVFLVVHYLRIVCNYVSSVLYVN